MNEFGVLSLLLTLSAFLIYVFTLGSFQFLFKNMNESLERRKSVLWISLLTTVFISLFFTGITILFDVQIANLLNLSSFREELILTIVATSTTSVMITFLYYHYGLGKNNFQNFLQFLRGSLWVIVSIALSIFLNLTLYKILITINVSMCLILLISFPWKDRSFIFPVRLSKSELFKLLKYCVPLMPYFMGVWGIPLMVRTELNIYEGAKHVAIFSVAYTLIEIVFMFISTITATLSPYFFSESDDNKNLSLFYNIMLKYSIICAVLILPFLYLLRYDIILAVSSDKYKVAGDYIPILIFFPIVRILVTVFEQFFLKYSQTVYLGITYTAGIILSYLLSIVLIPNFSILGAVYTSLIAYSVILLCLLIKQGRGLLDFKYLNLLGLAGFTLSLIIFVLALDFIEISNFYKIIPVGIFAVLGLFLFPVLNEKEKNKIFVLLKLKR